jgi:uncharacterized protein (UPF0276 family)
LYNPATSLILERAGGLVEYLAVMPDRLWFDFGPSPGGRRFHRTLGSMDRIRHEADNRVLAGHGIGLSLPSAIPIDEEFVAAVAAMSHDLGGFEWYSEHLSTFIAPKGSVPNAQAGLGLPLAYDDESLDLIAGKLSRLRGALGCRILLENGAFFTPMPDSDLSEPEFYNRLYSDGHCGALLDLHNVYVSSQHGGPAPREYLDALNPAAVEEIHVAGGDDFAGFYMDSHSSRTPDAVWEMAFEYVPKLPRLRAITFEFQETYFDRIKLDGVISELETMHRLKRAWLMEQSARSYADAS